MKKERSIKEAYNPLTRDGDMIREALEIEVRDRPLVIAFHALRNTHSNKSACDFDLNVEYIPSDEDYLDKKKHYLYVVIVPQFISANYSFYTLPKVWNPSNGAKLYTFEGHTASVCSVCSHSKSSTYYVFSTSSNRQIKAWLYENNGTSSTRSARNALVYSANGFTKIDENHFSMKMSLEIRKQKYLEALDKVENAKSLDVLKKQLKPFASLDEALFKDMTMLLTMDNFRENEQLSAYGDAKSARAALVTEMRRLIEANPLICKKVRFPNLKTSRLRTLINQSLNWQHQLCMSTNPNPDIKTLYEDHVCMQTNNPRPQLPPSILVTGPMLPRGRGFSPLGNHSLLWQQPSAQFPSSRSQQQQPSAQLPSSRSQQQQPSAQLPSSHSQQQQPSAQLPQSILVLVGRNAGEVSTWDVGTGKRSDGHDGSINEPAFSPPNNQL